MIYHHGHERLQKFTKIHQIHPPTVDKWMGKSEHIGTKAPRKISESKGAATPSELLHLAVSYGMPSMALLQLLVVAQVATATIDSPVATTAVPPQAPECMTMADPEDAAAERAEQLVRDLRTLPGSAERAAEQIVQGVPITSTFQGMSKPLSGYMLEKGEQAAQSAAYEQPFVVCNYTELHQLVKQIEQEQQLEAARADSKSVKTPITEVTIPPFEEDPQVFSPREMDVRLVFNPAEPTVEFFTSRDGIEYLLFMNNIGLQLYEVQREDKAITLLKRTEYLPLFSLINTKTCGIWGDVFVTKGPLGEVGFVALDLQDETTTCLGFAPSIEDAITDGFQLYSVHWYGLSLADYPTLALQNINGQLYAVMTANGAWEEGETYVGQPLLLVPLTGQKKGETGVQFNNPYPGGIPASILKHPEANQSSAQALRTYDVQNEGQRVTGVELYTADPATEIMTLTTALPDFALPYSTNLCYTTTDPIQAHCLGQYGSSIDALAMTDVFGKVAPVVAMDDGSLEIVHTDLVAVDAEQEPRQSMLIMTRLQLESEGHLTQKAQVVLRLSDAEGNHIDVTDNQVELLPDGSMVTTAVGLRAYNSNALVRIVISQDGTVSDARILASTQVSFLGRNLARVGDYAGAATTEGLTVRTHYLAYGSVVVLEAADGYTVQVDVDVVRPKKDFLQFLPFVSR